MTLDIAPEVRLAPPVVAYDEVSTLPERLFPDTFNHWTGAPGDPGSDEVLPIAWRTHAQGYLRTGLATPAAIDADGLLNPVIDKSRHLETGITYYLATNPDDSEDHSTARLIDVTSIEELPTYPLTKEGIHPDALGRLEDAIRSGKQIRELGALANSLPGNSPGARETLRHVLADTVGRNQLLFCSMVRESHRGLMHTLGPRNLAPIGKAVTLPENESRKETTLVPVIIDLDNFVQNIIDDYDESRSPSAKARLLQSALYYAEALPSDMVPPRIAELRETFLQEAAANEVAVQPPEVPIKTSSRLASYALAEHGQQWSEPQMFDLSNSDDWERMKGLLESGAVRSKHDPVSILAMELAKYNFPGEGTHSTARRQFVDDALAQGDAFGTWVYYPWSGVVSRFPNREDYQNLRTARNRDLITDNEQTQLLQKRIAVVGLSVGSRALAELVESGIGGEYIIADADHIETTNLGRLAAGYTSVGETKIDDAAKTISQKDPWAKQVHLRQGLGAQDLARMAELGQLPDLIVEEVDDMATKALIRLFAEEHGIPVVMAADIHDKSVVDVERYDLKDSKAVPFLGRMSRQDVQELAAQAGQLSPAANEQAMLKHAGVRHLSVRMMRSVMAIGTRLSGMPQLGMTANRGGSNVALIAREILLGRGPKSDRYPDTPRKTLGLGREHSVLTGIKTAVSLVQHVRKTKRAN